MIFSRKLGFATLQINPIGPTPPIHLKSDTGSVKMFFHFTSMDASPSQMGQAILFSLPTLQIAEE
jgi:hypothetical protein